MESSIIENHKKDNLVHFLKINIFGETGVGKTSLISLLENYSNDNYTIKNEQKNDNDNKSIDSDNELISMFEPIRRIVIDFNEDRKLYFNLYETDLSNYDLIKMNLDTLLYQTECIIAMWDSNNPDTFDNIPNLISTIEAGLEQYKFKNVPIFILENKIDLNINMENDGNEEINESINKLKKNKNIIYKKISLYDNDDFNELLLDIYRKMEIYEKDINKNKYNSNYIILYQIKIQHPLKNNINSINENNNSVNNEIKLLLLGDTQVGKSSFLNNLLENEFLSNEYSHKNINIIFPAKIFEKIINIKIIEDNFVKNLSEKNYKNIDGILLFFDLTNIETFNKINDWILSIKNNFGEINDSYELFLIGNKIEENEKRKISKKDAKNLAEDNQIKYFECSSLLGINNYEILNELLLFAFDKYNNKDKIENKNEFKKNNSESVKENKKEEEEEEEDEESNSYIAQKNNLKNDDNKICTNKIKKFDINNNELQRANKKSNNKKKENFGLLTDILIIILCVIIFYVGIQNYI